MYIHTSFVAEEVFELKTYEDFCVWAKEREQFSRDELQDVSNSKLSGTWLGRAISLGLVVEKAFHQYAWTNDTRMESTPSKKQKGQFEGEYPYDQDVRQGLFESKRDVGPLKPILVAESKDSELNGLVIDGFHRVSVDPSWPTEVRKIGNWKEYYQVRFQANIQHRKDHPEQLKRDLNAYCEKLVRMGVGRQSCAARVLEHLALGYNPDYLRTLIDPQYKDQTKSESAKSSVIMTPEEEKEMQDKEKKDEKVSRTKDRYGFIISLAVKAAVEIVQRKRITKCPHCRRSVPVPPLSDFEEKLMQDIEHRLTT